MNTKKRLMGTVVLAIIGLGLIYIGLNGLGIISFSSPSISVSHAYGETMTNQQLLSAGLLVAPHFNITPITTTTTTIPASPLTSHTIKTT
jgi:hypothetical protein